MALKIELEHRPSGVVAAYSNITTVTADRTRNELRVEVGVYRDAEAFAAKKRPAFFRIFTWPLDEVIPDEGPIDVYAAIYAAIKATPEYAAAEDVP